jgi:hypothetical protein
MGGARKWRTFSQRFLRSDDVESGVRRRIDRGRYVAGTVDLTTTTFRIAYGRVALAST